MRAQANGDTHRPRLDRTGTRDLQTLWTLGAVGGLSDADLLARFVAGTKHRDNSDAAELAFAALVDRHGGTVLRVARTILGDESASLDASQATFLLLAQKAWRLRIEDSLAPWLASVARRVALGVRKAEARRRRHETAAAARPEPIGAARTEVWSETIRAVLAEVDRLPENYRAAVVACHLEGLTQQAAADRLGWPLGTLQSRLDRGRRRLRANLTRRGLAPSVLALIPKSGLTAIFPSSLTSPLARAAVAWALKASPSALSLAPGVVAILQPTLKGAVMLKFTAAAVTLTTALGIAASGLGPSGDTPGPVPAARSSSRPDTRVEDVNLDGFKHPAPAHLLTAAGHLPLATPTATTDFDQAVSPSPSPAAIIPPVPAPGLIVPPLADAPLPRAPEVIASAIEESIPLAVKGPDLTTLLCIQKPYDIPSPGQPFDGNLELSELRTKGYPVREFALANDQAEGGLAERFQVKSEPTYLVISGSGEVVIRITGTVTTQELARKYNEYVRKLIRNRQEMEANSIPPPPQNSDLSLLCFLADWSPPCQEMESRVRLLAEKGYPVQIVDIVKQPGMAEQHKIRSIPAYVLTDADGRGLADWKGVLSASQVASLLHNNQQFNSANQTPRPATRSHSVQKDAASEPNLTLPVRYPQPWETAVRIKVKISDKEWGYGSGTVIASTPVESYVLGCAHTFRDSLDNPKQPTRQSRSIEVDLFGGQLEGQPPHLLTTARAIPAEVVAVDLASDLALIRIRPGKVLAVASIISESWEPNRGMKLITTGCSHGQDVTAWDTEIIDPKIRMYDFHGEQPFVLIKCKYQPAEGRSGGGLFTREGPLVGICNFADPNEHVGLYCGPAAFADLNKILQRTGDEVSLDLAMLRTALPNMKLLGANFPRAPEPAGTSSAHSSDRPPTTPDHQRLDTLERKLDTLLEGMNRNQNQSAPALRPRVVPLEADPGPVAPVLPSGEDQYVTERGFNEDGSESVVTRRNPRIVRPVPNNAILVPTEPILTPPVSGQERRLLDLERKLDRVLESLDNIRGQMNEKPGTSSL